jgi:uncharacterized protein YdcH (DUF465 family)
MNISLRKANAVQHSISEAIRSIKIETSIDLNEFQDIPTEITKANNILFTNDTRRQKLLLALYNIRSLVGQANAASGIDMKLATSAFIDKRVSQLEELSRASVITDLTVITGKIDKIKNRKEESRASLYGSSDTVTTSIISQEQLDQINAEIKNLKKQKQKLNDEILELNIKTDIPLSDEIQATLTAEGLV